MAVNDKKFSLSLSLSLSLFWPCLMAELPVGRNCTEFPTYCTSGTVCSSDKTCSKFTIFTISTGCQSAAGFNTKQLSSASTLSLVQLLHTALSCFIATLFLVLFAQPRNFGFSVFLGWAEGPSRKRFFQYIGPVIWNSFPVSVRHSSELS